jgi:choline-sulfatase
MYEEAAAIPMILHGPDVPTGKVSNTPVTLVDGYPTILECVGEPPSEADTALPGRSLWQIAQADDDPDRIAFSEYHASGAVTGAFMLRRGRYKFIHYLDMAPQLFDLESDPLERNDLAGDTAHAALLRDMDTRLREICDPEAVDRRAKADQAALVERHGGREAVVSRGTFSGTPAPGDKAVYG